MPFSMFSSKLWKYSTSRDIRGQRKSLKDLYRKYRSSKKRKAFEACPGPTTSIQDGSRAVFPHRWQHATPNAQREVGGLRCQVHQRRTCQEDSGHGEILIPFSFGKSETSLEPLNPGLTKCHVVLTGWGWYQHICWYSGFSITRYRPLCQSRATQSTLSRGCLWHIIFQKQPATLLHPCPRIISWQVQANHLTFLCPLAFR